jgi:hypothetical protein
MILHLLILLAATLPQPADPPAAPATNQPTTPAPVPSAPLVKPENTEPPSAMIDRFKSRLEALQPNNPESYYLLGEEVADQSTDPGARRLAEELYVLAYDLAAAHPDRPGRAALQAGACVALADHVRIDRDRRWLIALARTLDPRRVPPEWLARQAPATTDSAAYQVATVLGLVRSGDGGQARQLLQHPEVKAAFDAYDRLMVNIGIQGGASRIMREAERWPCRECQNERIVMKGNPPVARLCSNCEGDPGSALTGAEFIAQLRFESLILQGAQRSWAAQVAADSGAPLTDPDAGGLAAAFDVDSTLVLWRNGHWVADPNAAPRTKPAPPAKKPENPPAAPAPAPAPAPSGATPRDG